MVLRLFDQYTDNANPDFISSSIKSTVDMTNSPEFNWYLPYKYLKNFRKKKKRYFLVYQTPNMLIKSNVDWNDLEIVRAIFIYMITALLYDLSF